MSYDPSLGYDPDYDPWAGAAPQGGADSFAQGLTALYQQYYHRDPTAQEIESHRGNPQGLAGIEGMLRASQGSGKDELPAPQKDPGGTGAPPPGPTPPPATPGPKITDSYDQPFVSKPPVDLGGPPGIPYVPPTPSAGPAPTPPPTPTYTPPVFTPPAYKPPPAFAYEAFKAPGVEEALNDPGYQFRTQQGEQALQRWAAAKGTLNDSGTAHALIDYGQQAGSQEYQNVWNRDYNAWTGNRQNALDTYATNYGSQYADPYRFAYQGATDAFAPEMAGFGANVGATNTAYSTTNANNVLGFSTDNANKTLGYSTQAAAGQHQTDMNYLNDWNKWLQDWNIFRDQRDSTWDKNWQYANS